MAALRPVNHSNNKNTQSSLFIRENMIKITYMAGMVSLHFDSACVYPKNIM